MIEPRKGRSVRRCARALLLAFAWLATASSGQAEGTPLLAHVECPRATAPGRIVCEVTANAATGRLVWVDALVVRAPAFARPLRSRVVAPVSSEGAPGNPNSASAKLALVASELGTGELEVRVRAVICSETASGEWCGPELASVTAPVVVESAPLPAP